MDRDELQKEVGNLLRLVALLFGVIGAAGAAMIILLLISKRLQGTFFCP